MRVFFAAVICLLVLVFVPEAFSQKGKIVSRVCGDPSAACAKRAAFKNDDIPFSYGENAVVAQTATFSAVVLRCVILTETADCGQTSADFKVDEFQWNFLKNKVFVARGCYSILNNFYTKVGDNVIALAVYAGSTKAQADAFLKKVKAMEHVGSNGAYVIRLATGFNGT